MIVQDSGPLDSKIFIVAESPGRTEEQSGRPFVGASGQLLKQMLQHSGIDFNSCFVTNVSPERPPNGKFMYFYEGKTHKEPSERLLKWQQELRDKIERLKPNVVILLGAEALKAVTNKKGIEAWRGSIMTYKNVKLIATYHPAAVIRKYSFHPVVEMDLAKANKESQFPDVRYDKYNIISKPSLTQALQWMDECSNYPRVGWDIETVGKHVRCVGLARGSSDNPEALVIPFIKFPSTDMVMPGTKNIIRIGNVSETMSSYWNEHDELLILNALDKIMSGKMIQKVGHNSISFDAPLILEEFKMETNNHSMDTMHAFHLLYSELPMGLKFLNTIMLNIPNYWTGKETVSDESEWHYNGLDAICTLLISYKLDEELHDADMMGLYRSINDLAIALTRVQDRGITIDTVARDKMIVEQRQKLKDTEKRIIASVSKATNNPLATFNPNSPKQVKELLYDTLKFPTIFDKGKVSTGEVALRKLVKRYPNETVINDIINYRKVSKLINTFLDINLDDDGKMRTCYNASGTKSGRISSSKTLWKTGMNLQNIPVGKSKGVENIRNIFVPTKGKVFIKADLSQAEALAVAEILYRHGDSTLRDLHKVKDFDIHTWMIDQLYKHTGISSLKDRRDIGKLANHSGNYGAGPNVLVNKAAKEEIEGIDYKIAQSILSARHKAIPGLRIWWKWVERQLRKTRTLTTCFGRTRYFFGRLDDTTFRDAYSFEPQSIVGDVTNRILTKIEMNPDSKLDVLLQVHDEVDGECYAKDVDAVNDEIQKASIIPLFINDIPLIIPMDVEVGSNWRDVISYKKYKGEYENGNEG